MRSIVVLLTVLLSVNVFAQKPKKKQKAAVNTAQETTVQQATRYLLDVIASRDAEKGSFLDLKGTKRRTDPGGTDIFNITGLKPFGAADQYLMLTTGSFTSFVAEFKGAESAKVVSAIIEGLPGSSPAGVYGYKVVPRNPADGSKQYTITKGGKSFAIFAEDLTKNTGMLVINGR